MRPNFLNQEMLSIKKCCQSRNVVNQEKFLNQEIIDNNKNAEILRKNFVKRCAKRSTPKVKMAHPSFK